MMRALILLVALVSLALPAVGAEPYGEMYIKEAVLNTLSGYTLTYKIDVDLKRPVLDELVQAVHDQDGWTFSGYAPVGGATLVTGTYGGTHVPGPAGAISVRVDGNREQPNNQSWLMIRDEVYVPRPTEVHFHFVMGKSYQNSFETFKVWMRAYAARPNEPDEGSDHRLNFYLYNNSTSSWESIGTRGNSYPGLLHGSSVNYTVFKDDVTSEFVDASNEMWGKVEYQSFGWTGWTTLGSQVLPWTVEMRQAPNPIVAHTGTRPTTYVDVVSGPSTVDFDYFFDERERLQVPLAFGIDIMPGNYWLQSAWYNEADGEWVQVLNSENPPIAQYGVYKSFLSYLPAGGTQMRGLLTGAQGPLNDQETFHPVYSGVHVSQGGPRNGDVWPQDAE